MMRSLSALSLYVAGASACDSLSVLPSATADGLGGMYGKNADRHRTEAQPVAAYGRKKHLPGTMFTLDSGLKIPQVATTYAHAGSRPNWAHPHGGYSEGVNEFGVSIGNEMFPAHHLPTDDGKKPQAEFTDLDRLVLERAKTAKEAVLVFADLVGKYGQTCKHCPEAANYNSLFMISDPKEIYSLMAVGHEWGWKQFTNDDLNGTGVWTISNRYFPGVPNTQISPTAIATARSAFGYNGTDAEFDFGLVYGSINANPTRQIRSSTLLRDLAADHKLTRMPHWDGTEIDEHTEKGGLSASSMVSDFTLDGVRKIAWVNRLTIMRKTMHCRISPGSLRLRNLLLKTFSIRNSGAAAYWTEPLYDCVLSGDLSFLVLTDTICTDLLYIDHEGRISPMPDWLVSNHPWWGFRYVIYTLAGQNHAKIKLVQDTWKPIQQRFFDEAEKAATAAESMTLTEADVMLGDLLGNFSTTIRNTLEIFNETLGPDGRYASMYCELQYQ